MISLLYADSPAPAAQAPSPFGTMVPMLVIFVIFYYFLLIRPQQKKVSQHKKMLSDLKVGDKVITNSGIYAVVVGVGDSTLDVKIADNVKIKVLKSSVSEALGSGEAAAPVAAKTEK